MGEEVQLGSPWFRPGPYVASSLQKNPPARLPDEAGVTSLASDRPLEAWAGSASSLHPHDGTTTTHRTRQEQRASRPTGPLRLGRGALVRYSCMGPLWSHIGPRNGPNNLGAPPGHTAQHSTAQHSTTQHGTAQHTTAQLGATRHSTAQHTAAQHSTAHRSTAQHSTAHRSTAHGTARHSTIHRTTAVGSIWRPFWTTIVIKEGRRTARHRAAHHRRHDDTDDYTDDAQGAA